MFTRSWLRACVRIAGRDLRSSCRHSLTILAAIAAGTAAIAAVGGLSTEMRSKLKGDAREWIASDVYVNLPETPTADDRAALATALRGTQDTLVTEFYAMASSDQAPDAELVFLKVVDPRSYPFYGTVRLQPEAPLADALSADSVAVSADLLDKLRLKPGDPLHLGRSTVRVAAAIAAEPDWSAGVSSVLPRILMSPQSFERSGLAPQGDVEQKWLFRVPAGSLAGIREALQQAFPYSDVVDYRDPDPAAAAAFDQAALFLNLAAWMALAVGSLAMALMLHLHIQSRLDSVAIMKSLGARLNQVLAIYGLQALALGFTGGGAGALLGYPLEGLLLRIAGNAFPVGLSARWDGRVILLALGAGVLSAIPAFLGPILNLRRVPPLRFLRRHVESPVGKMRRPARLRRLRPLSLRLALRNLSRAGNHSVTVAAGLAAGVALLSASLLCQQRISEAVAESVPANGSSLYVISAGPRQLHQAVNWLSSQSLIQGTPEVFPLVWLRLTMVNGAPPAESSALPGTWLSSCSDDVKPGQILRSSEALALQPGDQLRLSFKDREIRGTVASGTAGYLEAVVSVLVFSCSAFEDLPVFYHAALRTLPGQEEAVRRRLAEKFPGMGTLSRAAFSGFVETIARRAIAMVKIVSAAVLAMGLGLQMLLIASAKQFRTEEVAVTRALGGQRAQLVRAFLLEYGVLGFGAGLSGGIVGSVLGSFLLSELLHRRTILDDWRIPLAAALLTALASACAGALAGAGLLRRTPLEVLRAE